MGVSWKDGLVAYVSGSLLFLILLYASIPPDFAFLVFVIPYAIPLGYYFWNNRCGSKEAAVLSIAFGVTLLPALILLVWAFASVLALSGTARQATYESDTNWLDLLPITLAFNILVSAVVGLAVWFITHRARRAS